VGYPIAVGILTDRMSGAQRAAILGLAAIVAIVAFLVLRPEDSDDDEPQRTNPTAQPEPTTTTPTETGPAPTATPKEPEVPLIRVRGGRPVGGVQTIDAEEGETVRFRVQTETPQEVHLHGYDLTESTTSSRPAEFRFEADQTGIYELEIHSTHTQIGELKVEP
jgi:FtsP/CotA-like multicopper oxidase with cupredoxin domain